MLSGGASILAGRRCFSRKEAREDARATFPVFVRRVLVFTSRLLILAVLAAAQCLQGPAGTSLKRAKTLPLALNCETRLPAESFCQGRQRTLPAQSSHRCPIT